MGRCATARSDRAGFGQYLSAGYGVSKGRYSPSPPISAPSWHQPARLCCGRRWRSFSYFCLCVLIAFPGLPVWLGHHPVPERHWPESNRCGRRFRSGPVQSDLAQRCRQGRDVAITLVGFLLLKRWRVPPLAARGGRLFAVPRRSAVGHFEPVPPPTLNGRCPFS